MSKKRSIATKEGTKAVLKKIGKRSAATTFGLGAAMLSPQKAYGGQLSAKQLKEKYGFKEFGGDGGPLPKKKTKLSMRKPKKSKICPAGIAWAKRTFDKYPSAYANMAASKYCKDPNYGKKNKK